MSQPGEGHPEANPHTAAMRLGIDFDNTIVCYDALFHRVAREGGWIPANLPANKTDVRNHLRQTGREEVWTRLQGEVYGARMAETVAYPGVLEFLLACRRAAVPVCIISHKTRRPFLGDPHDLHQAARNWLEQQGAFDPDRLGLGRDQVFFELTKAAKLKRIGQCACTHFIDDLPEFLAEPDFPSGVQRILFDPNDQYPEETRFVRLSDWRKAGSLLLPARSETHTSHEPPGEGTGPTTTSSPGPPTRRGGFRGPGQSRPTEEAPIEPVLADFLHRLGLPPDAVLDPLPGGANNRVYCVRSRGERLVLKRYFHDPADPRDRFGAEQAFYTLAWNRGLRCLPEPLGWDPVHRLGLFRFVPGPRLTADQVDAGRIAEALAFVAALNATRHTPDALALPVASEACFSLTEHLACLARRVERLLKLDVRSAVDAQAAALVREELAPAWRQVRDTIAAVGTEALAEVLPHSARCLSPSDFGFHNARLDPEGRLQFFDFEYAGWDDPAKLVCDFFCQPQVPVPPRYLDSFVAELDHALGGHGEPATRVRQLLPVYRLKWCCIRLNEFLPADRARRDFAGVAPTAAEIEARKATQLEKARRALREVKSAAGG